MYIQCTQAVLKKLGLEATQVKKGSEVEEKDDFYSFHVHTIRVGRKSVVVCMNNLTTYPLIFTNVKKKDYQDLGRLIVNNLRYMLLLSGITKEKVNQYCSHLGEVQYTTTNRKYLAKLKDYCERLKYYPHLLEEDYVFQTKLTKYLARNGMILKNHFYYPEVEMLQALAMMNGLPSADLDTIQQIENYEFKISMQLENHEVYRKVLVPIYTNFDDFHDVIQIAFDWFNYHSYEYEIPNENNTNKRYFDMPRKEFSYGICHPVNIDSEFDKLAKFEYKSSIDLKLKDIFEHKTTIFYLYDLGDCWVHTITLEKKVKCANSYPRVLEGKGNRPPEDVGGEGGYEEFLKITSDPKNPDYERLNAWATEQNPKEMDLVRINSTIRNCLYESVESIYGRRF